ncbi:MAG: hypothetical protein QGH74_04745, partial [Candidatus Brocadiia bacterium]|nr:hypothetical protein [Candidatus Brocadiia bacterium]
MRERKTRLAVLAAAVAVVVFVLGACIFPVAWSPDSKRVVFSIPLADPDKGMAHGLAMADRLAMVDLEGKMIRDVARVGDSENESFSPAAWSPDGKWIAYFRFEPKPAEGALDPDHPEEDEATILVSLMLQEADSGKEGIIFQEDVPKDNYDWGANALYGPQWTADSKALMIRNMSAAQPGLVVLNLQGGIVLDVPLDDELGRVTAALSPDGASLAYLRRLPFKDFDWQWEICVLDIKAGTTRVLGQGVSEDGPWGRPA